MAQRFKYFTTCGEEQAELYSVHHAGGLFDPTIGRDRCTNRPYAFVGYCSKCNLPHVAQRQIDYKALPSLHTCNAKCIGGKVNGVCECQCGGKNHAVGSLFNPAAFRKAA
jgi:hypothetical protein